MPADPWLWLIIGASVVAGASLHRRVRTATQSTTGAPPEEAAPAVLWSSTEADFRPSAEAWPLAAAAIYEVCNEHPWDQMEAPDRAPVLAMLRGAWGVSHRSGLLEKLLWLLVEGHRAELRGLVTHVAQCSDPQIDAIRAEITRDADLSADDRKQLLWRVDVAWRNERQIQSETFVAWDFARFLMLCKAGATCGFITEGEARDFMTMACIQLKQSYRGWRDFGDQFLRGRWFWQGLRSPDTDQAWFDRVIHVLEESPGSPWRRLPWGLELPRCRWLLVEALHAADLLPLLSEEERADTHGWRLALDSALREKQLDVIPATVH